MKVLVALAYQMANFRPEAVTLARQSRRVPPTSNEKKNKRPAETPGKEGEQEPLPKDLEPVKPQDLEKVSISTQIVNIDAVVYHKKSGQIVTGLKKPNFAIFADGAPQTITNFSTPEAPITVAMVVEYSKWSEYFGYASSRGYEPGTYEVIRPTAMFLSQFIKPPDDYASVVAFDIRPTPLTDFTNDPGRINAVIGLLLRNTPAFRETNLFDALKFVLVGGPTQLAAAKAGRIMLWDTWPPLKKTEADELKRARGNEIDVAQNTINTIFLAYMHTQKPPFNHPDMRRAVHLALDRQELVAKAHTVCPYSNATRGNVDVELQVA